MRLALIFALLLTLGGLVAIQRPASSQSLRLVVTSAADPGDGRCDDTCTLRDALLLANAVPGPSRIEFAIGNGPVVIRPLAALPIITDAGTVIDGTTQPGYDGRPIVMLDGSETSEASGLISEAADVEFRGLVVGNFARFGLAAIGDDADGNRFLGNWVGMELDGRTAAPNLLSGIAVVAGADNAIVGDVCEGCGNRVGGNSNEGRTGHGILIGGRGAVGTRVRGNVVGLDIDGRALPNDDGILVVDRAQASIGGRSAGERNVVSGNAVAGIEVRDTTSFLTIAIEGNYVGLDEAGVRGVANDVGIFINGTAANVVIGAAAASAGNVISGNRVGVAIEQRASGISVVGNVIGLDARGRRVVGNREDGISVVAGAREVQIGGEAPGEGNWIGGNGIGIEIADAATTDVRVEGNTLGLAVDGEGLAANGTGIRVSEAAEVVIGGSGRTGNVIVGSSASGVVLDGATRTVVRGNRIGLRADDSAVANAVGVTLRNGTLDSQVQENRIGGNLGPGIQVLGEETQRNRLTRNVFLNNLGLGIDLNGDGPTANDIDDVDRGPNDLINAPEITEATSDGLATTVRGSGVPRTRVELYRISSPRPPFSEPHPSGFGAGAELLGVTRVKDDGSWQMALAIEATTPLTALTVDAGGNTSEFARNFFPEQPIVLSAGFTPAGWFGPATLTPEAFAPVGARLQAAFRFEATTQTWSVYRPGLPFLSDLAALQPGDALWLLLDAGGPVIWTQPAAEPEARAVTLQRGLNFVTWTGPPAAAAAALVALGESVEIVFRWNAAAGQFDIVLPALPLPSVSSLLAPRDLLWIRVRTGGVWEQPSR
ncbi:MAG: right-handed parallel beta-helix repeat-containing protein [Dehalococcoidia bacterium]